MKTNLNSGFLSPKKSIIEDLERRGHYPTEAILMAVVLSDLFYVCANYETSFYNSMVTRSYLSEADYNRYLRYLIRDGYIDLERNLVFAMDSDGMKYTELIDFHWPKRVVDYLSMLTDEELSSHSPSSTAVHI